MKRLQIIVGGVLLLGWLVVHVTRAKEPSYQGRTLTSYLAGPWVQVDGPQQENPHYGPDEKAIRAIGTNGIPTLLRLIQAHDPPWKAKLISWLKRQHMVHIDIQDATERRDLGILGFSILGEEAKSAVPDLVILIHGRDPAVRTKAVRCLSSIHPGKETLVPIMVQLLRDPQPEVQDVAGWALYLDYPEEAEKAGVHKMIPELKTPATNTVEAGTP
ncbi:MAG TPA: HEAT repeat domain-containing protein [Verrucomicrobiae bacterium]|nr:HEAT repeat domain-containing protein [Verrucomicrobiae bacterium]